MAIKYHMGQPKEQWDHNYLGRIFLFSTQVELEGLEIISNQNHARSLGNDRFLV